MKAVKVVLMLIHMMMTCQKSVLFQLGREILIGEVSQTGSTLGLVQIAVALDESNESEIFWICASANLAAYATEVAKLEVNGNMVTLQPASSQLFSEKEDFIMKYEVNQSPMKSPSFIIFHYYHEGDVNVAHYTTTNALFKAEIKTLPLDCIFFDNEFSKPMKVKGDGSCLYQAIASHIMSYCLKDVWTGRFPPGKKPGIKPATHDMVNDLTKFISQKDNDLLQKL